MKRNYFENVNCIEELKKQYFALAKKFHSDINGGNDEDMKLLNAEYDEMFKIYKDIHLNTREDVEEETYTAKDPTSEVAEDFINIIRFLLSLKGLEVELCGRWIWISGDTKVHKDLLKAMGCKWAATKKMWSWHYNGDAPGYRKKGAKDIGYIRNKYGSTSYRTDEALLLA